MNDPNDSDGSWEFVDKDSDSDTSSVAAPYDTGLPDESPEIAENAWNNDDFITDSDIEACAEESGGSEVGGPSNSQDDACDVREPETAPDGNDQSDDSSQPNEMTKSMIDYNEEIPDSNQNEAVVELKEEEQNKEDEEDTTSSSVVESRDDITDRQDVEEEVADMESQRSDNTDIDPDDEEKVSVPVEESTSSKVALASDSEFERVESNVDDAEIVEGASTSNSIGMIEPGDDEMEASVESGEEKGSGSDTGSSDFTVIAAPASPPVEILSQETSTSYTSRDEEDMPHPSEPTSLDVEVATNRMTVDMATDPILANQRTVGMVTDHVTPPNQRFLISIAMISFGVGFLLGQYPLEHPLTLVFKVQNPEIQLREPLESFKETLESSLEAPETFPTCSHSLKKIKLRNEALRQQVKIQKMEMMDQNRRMHNSLQDLEEEKIRDRQVCMRKKKMMQDHHIMLAQNFKIESHQSMVEIEDKKKEIKKLKSRVINLENENLTLNRSTELLRRLEEQHLTLISQYKEKLLKDSENLHLKHHQFLTVQVRKTRSEMRRVLLKLWISELLNEKLEKELKEKEAKLEELSKSTTKDATPPAYQDMSPLMKALAEQQDASTCSSNSEAQVMSLESRVKTQRSHISKLSEDTRLQWMALKSAQNDLEAVRKYSSCLEEQFSLKTEERESDSVSFCSNPDRYKMENEVVEPVQVLPQCVYAVNGTLTYDLSTLDLSVNVEARHNTTYKLSLVTQPSLTQYFFNATLLYSELSNPPKGPSKPKSPSCDLNDASSWKRNIKLAPTLPLFVPAIVYHHSEASSARVRFELARFKSQVMKLEQVCKAREESLRGRKQEVESTRKQLVTATRDIKLLKQQRNQLYQRLFNLTDYTKEIPSMKQCFKAAFNPNNILKQLNTTKGYKVASKVAQKMKKVTGKAWNKLSKLISKFEPHQDREFDDDEFKNGNKKSKSHRRDLTQTHRDDDDFHKFKTHERLRKKKKSGRRDFKRIHKDDDDDEENKRTFRESADEEHGKKDGKKRKVWCHNRQSNYKKQEKEEKRRNKDHGRKEKRKHRREQHERSRFGETDENIHETKNQKYKNKKGNYETHSGGDSAKSRRRQRREEDLFSALLEESMQHAEAARKKIENHMMPIYTHFKDRFSSKLGEGMHHVEKAKKKIENQVKPIYDGFKDRFCNLEEDLIPDSVKEIWCPLKQETEEETENRTSSVILDVPSDLDISSTSEGDWQEVDASIDDSSAREDVEDFLVVESGNVGELEMDDDLDSQWFARMFKAREEMRNLEDNLQPLSDEEFDWYLGMFESRENLRRNMEDPKEQEVMDWYLKMFEARARLRFEEGGKNVDTKNWYLRMFEERSKARDEGSDVKGDWYLKMSKARETMRGQQGNGDWYQAMADARERARKESTEIAERGGWSNGWCQA